MVVQCRITFKMNNKCESKRDVTIVCAFNYYYSSLLTILFHIEKTYKRFLHPTFKSLLKYKDETCFNLSLVELYLDPTSMTKVDNLKSADRFYGASIILRSILP